MAAIRKRVALAACALLGIAPKAQSAEQSEESESWNLDTSILSYSESNRISIFEPTVSARKEFQRNRALDLFLTVDTISGVTPIGTLPKKKVSTPAAQTVSAASGGGSSAGSGGGGSSGVTLDVPTTYISDVRYAFGSSWQQPVGYGATGKVGANISVEKDFQSVGASFLLSRDFNRKNTTFSLGVSPEFDRVKPRGGVPDAFADPNAVGALGPSFSSKKDVGYIVGLTQIFSPRILMQFNYSQTRERGDLTDPYKMLSIVDSVTGDPLSSVYEKRPDKRKDQSYYWLTRYHLDGDVVSAAYRYYSDDWGIRSHTMDLNYHWNVSDIVFLEPRFRFYHQSKADFFRIGLVNGDPLPTFASADYRLSKFDAYTVGLKYGCKIGEKSLLLLRFDYYTQLGDHHPDSAIGIQKGFDLFPALQALIFQAQLSFDPATVAEDFSTFFR